MIAKQFEHLYEVPIKWDIIKHGTYMRDTTELWCTERSKKMNYGIYYN